MTDDQVALFEKMKPSSVTCILAKKGQNPTLKKAKDDLGTYLDRFPWVNIVHWVHYDSFFIILWPFLISEAMLRCGHAAEHIRNSAEEFLLHAPPPRLRK